MRDLFDRRGSRGGTRPDERRPEGETPVEVVTHRGKVYLRPVGAAPVASKAGRTPLGVGHLGPFAIGVVLMAGLVVATVAFMAAFSATFEVATRALPEGSLTAPLPDAALALASERDRHREALAGYDRHIAGTASNPPLQAAWLDLKRCEAETLEQLDRHLENIGASHPPPAAVDHVP